MTLRAGKCVAVFAGLACAGTALAEPPSTAYIFPAGGQRGTVVRARVGGHFLHDRTAFHMAARGIAAPSEIERTSTVWFEGPLIRQPASQQAEDYPKDYAVDLEIDADAPLGDVWWRVANAQGATPRMRFVVGELPEVVEEEIDGDPIPVGVTLPVTINGRIFPREDVDVWQFSVDAGCEITCHAAAQEFGSPLAARIEVRDPAGRPVAEAIAASRTDASLHFVAKESGTYSAFIHDIRYDGLQTHIYRLTVTDGPWLDTVFPLGGQRGATVAFELDGQCLGDAPASHAAALPDGEPGPRRVHLPRPPGAQGAAGQQSLNPVWLDIGEFPEAMEHEPNDAAAAAGALRPPAVGNGRIQTPGDVDCWRVPVAQGDELTFRLRAARLDSALDGVLVLRDGSGKELARGGEIRNGVDDLSLSHAAAADGELIVEIHDRSPQRGGRRFGYRLVVEPAQPRWGLDLDREVIAVVAGSDVKIPVRVARTKFDAPIKIELLGLPEGVTSEPVVAMPGQEKIDLLIKASADVPVWHGPVRVVGTPQTGEVAPAVEAVVPVPLGHPDRRRPWLAVGLATPFKFKGVYDFRYIPCGTTMRKRYEIVREGYDGPLVIELADRQGRHLQGVTGPRVVVPAGATEFEYPLSLPPWMELGRTSRTNLMATGEIPDASGKLHKVVFTTRDQNEQMVALVSPAVMRLRAEPASIAAVLGGQAELRVVVRRDASVTGDVTVEAVIPPHGRDVAAEPLTIPANADTGTLRLRFGEAPGPFTQPLVIRATADRGGDRAVAETTVDVGIVR
jgi:hypothetical protein